MRVSVIISTYNSPDWLAKVIWGYANQSTTDFQIVIADDGSTEVTRKRIDELRNETGLTIDHVWHPDNGFRKCTILNSAIRAATGDYLIFSDGDCIPRTDFVQTHLSLAQPNQFLSGGLYRLPMKLSQQITHIDITSGRFAHVRWLRKNGVSLNLNLIRLSCSKHAGYILDKLTPTRPTWNGHNSSGWKKDIIAVNGFDERMEYGAEDREMGERLVHRGIRPIQIRHRAICVHLDHARGYVNDAAWKRNREIWKGTILSHRTWTDHGIEQKNKATEVSRAA